MYGRVYELGNTLDFFKLFTSKTFRGEDYLNYLTRPIDQRSGDEASIVDTAIVSQLLGLLGFEPAERVYNLQRQHGRPDFAPTDPLYGTCYVVEDKNTSLDLTFDLAKPESHISQLISYMRLEHARVGWLTNGKQFTVWESDQNGEPIRIIDIDIPTSIREWLSDNPATLSQSLERSFRDLFDLCHKKAFTDPQRLEKEIASNLKEWHASAIPLHAGSSNEFKLVRSLQSLVQDLQSDARRMLDRHLARHAEYIDKAYRLTDNSPEPAIQQFKVLRDRVISILIDRFQLVWGLETEDIAAIEDILLKLEQNVRLFVSPKELLKEVLDILNSARQKKYPSKSKAARPMSNLDEFPALSHPLQGYIDKVFTWHQRQAILNHDYQTDKNLFNDYTAWKSLVQETMLGGLDEEQRRSEFALQAAYVVFIRLLLIRICEDKGVFRHRFISDGGLKHWQENIEQYYDFANGNPYSYLLDMAYEKTQNIYAHFFTGRELFNWYQLDRERFILSLYQLSRFDFAEVDSDIIGTVYNTYVNRAE